MAIAWVLRDKRITSALIGARNVEQLDNSLDALMQLQFTDVELTETFGETLAKRPRSKAVE
jgi:L-glyceraldehyde 3-phosphate reductase